MDTPKKILIIDDEDFLAKILREKIGHEGYVVITARDGEQGLATALAEHPDLILLDIIMPKMDGITMLKKLRQDSWGKNAAVLILSNLSNAQTVEESLSSGATDFLVKVDYSLEDLMDIIKKRIS